MTKEMDKDMEKERLLIEYTNLVEKISTLKALENENYDLVYEQYKAMNKYKEALAIRILTIMGRFDNVNKEG